MNPRKRNSCPVQRGIVCSIKEEEEEEGDEELLFMSEELLLFIILYFKDIKKNINILIKIRNTQHSEIPKTMEKKVKKIYQL
jgi:hypothetical protein